MKTLVLGGARSGKSRYAENAALQCGSDWVYLATGVAGDQEMAERIECHKRDRDARWQLVEEPVALARQLQALDQPRRTILVDCLTLWLCNTLEANVYETQRLALMDYLPRAQSNIYFVSNEVGSGVVPLGNLSRTFVDQAGWLNQALAKLCDRAVLVVAGLPLELK